MKKYRQPNKKEQGDYETAVMAGMKVLYDERTYPQIVEMLAQGRENPMETIGFAVSTIIRQIQQSLPLSDNVLQGVVIELSALVAEIAKKEGFFEVTKKQMPNAVAMVMKMLAGKPEKQTAQQQPAGQPAGGQQAEQQPAGQAPAGTQRRGLLRGGM